MVFHHPETLTALCGSSVVCGSTPLSAWLPVHKIDIPIKQQEMIRTIPIWCREKISTTTTTHPPKRVPLKVPSNAA